jgi:putative hemolysin
MTVENKQLRVDVAEVLRSKNERLAKIIPNFLINLLKRIIHQNEINEMLAESGNLEGVEFIKSALGKLNVSYKVKGLEKLEDGKSYIFASNHPLGGLDGMILIEVLGNKFGTLKVIGNDLLYSLEPLKNTFIPVNKHGRQNRDTLTNLNSIFESNSSVLFFPAGLCSRKKKGVIVDLPWHKTYVSYAIKYKRDIVPIFFSGKNSDFFYNSANFRTFLGIKFNYEMLLLPHEMFKQRNNSFEITIGEPIKHEKLKNEHTPAFWADEIKKETYNLKD